MPRVVPRLGAVLPFRDLCVKELASGCFSDHKIMLSEIPVGDQDVPYQLHSLHGGAQYKSSL